MARPAQWLIDLEPTSDSSSVSGLVFVNNYSREELTPEQVFIMEKAKFYKAQAVFFEESRNGRPPIPQAFIYISNGPAKDTSFGEIHQRLWSWGGVPLIYRKTPGLIQLFRCAHKPDFVKPNGEIFCNPKKYFEIASEISNYDAWWDASQLRNGTLWDDPKVCKELLSSQQAAHKRLFNAIKELKNDLNQKKLLKKHLQRKLLILSLLISYLEERGVFQNNYFQKFLSTATKYFHVLANGNALVALLDDLKERFNGNVFELNEDDRNSLKNNTQLARYANFVEGCTEKGGQLNLWQLYSFKDLPVELISNIYQLFVKDSDSSVYTPPFLVRLMLEEALSPERMERLIKSDEIILDPCCGSGVFLVEAYKRLVLYWRSCNEWKNPSDKDLKELLKRVHGIDLEEGAVELADFSLCLALCDALEPEAIRKSYKLFPVLEGITLHKSCFFEAKEKGLINKHIGIVVGNPPFRSNLNTPGAIQSYKRYNRNYPSLPDKQLAYLFLHEVMDILVEGGLLCMLQQYNFLYNQKSKTFRQNFIEKWNVREILDFISVRGLFQKGNADTKVIVIAAEASKPKEDQKTLHAVFRRSGRTDAEQGFDIDYYDMHWLPRELVLANDQVWRSNLLGGGRVLSFVNRLKELQTIKEFADKQGWDYGEGFIVGKSGNRQQATHLTGEKMLPSNAITENGIDRNAIITVTDCLFESSRSSKRFTPPMLLIREQMDLHNALWEDHYLTYKNEIVGICADKSETKSLNQMDKWINEQHEVLKAYAAGISVRLFTRKATALSEVDILSLPYPESGTFDLSNNEQIIVEDIIHYYRDLIRLGVDSKVMKESGQNALNNFTDIYTKQINTIYKKNPLKPLEPQLWPGIICQPFVFGHGQVDWNGAEELKDKLDILLKEQKESSLQITRIARIYDSRFIFLLKPDRLRYWLRSIALRDADETLADLRGQRF